MYLYIYIHRRSLIYTEDLSPRRRATFARVPKDNQVHKPRLKSGFRGLGPRQSQTWRKLNAGYRIFTRVSWLLFSPSYFSVLLKPARGLFTKVELYHRINQRRELVLTFLRQGWHGWEGPFAWPFACSMDELPKTAVRHSYQLREFHGDITCSVNSRGALLCIYIYIYTYHMFNVPQFHSGPTFELWLCMIKCSPRDP